MQPWQTELLGTLAVTVFIVYRFVKRELGARTVRKRTLWIRPAFLVAILAFLTFETLQHGQNVGEWFAAAVFFGVLCGAATGVLVVRSTTFSSAGMPGAVRVHGSRVTAALWIGAFALRLVARLAVPHSDVGDRLALDSGLVALIAVAFTIVALAFHREIDRYSGLPAGETRQPQAITS